MQLGRNLGRVQKIGNAMRIPKMKHSPLARHPAARVSASLLEDVPELAVIGPESRLSLKSLVHGGLAASPRLITSLAVIGHPEDLEQPQSAVGEFLAAFAKDFRPRLRLAGAFGDPFRTPSGVGAFRDPPIYMKDGDEVIVEIEGIGKLVNKCRTTG